MHGTNVKKRGIHHVPNSRQIPSLLHKHEENSKRTDL